jgi:uncharacterized protein YjbI with pentapeptide repeats
LSGVNLLGAKLTGADLHKAILKEGKYNADTTWPTGFDPEEAEAIKVKD